MTRPRWVAVRWLPFGVRAMALYPFVFLTDEVAEDACIQEHELYHWREQRRWFLVPWLAAYLIVGIFYLGRPASHHPMEREAYRIQRDCEAASDD